MNNCIERVVEIDKRLEKKSLFLFGPRQTGRSSYIMNQLAEPRLSWTLLGNKLYRSVLPFLETPSGQRESMMMLSFSMKSRGCRIFSMKSICYRGD